MKALGEAAVDLPWLSPCVASLTTLARSQLPALPSDAGMALLLARAQGNRSELCTDSPLRFNDDALELAVQHLTHGPAGFVDWSAPGPAFVLRVCTQQARLAAELAGNLGHDPRRAWTAGLLAPLGWLAVCAIDPEQIVRFRDETPADRTAWQRVAWGLDQTAIARRLSRRWRLPSWLSIIIGHLGLHVSIAGRLGADKPLFQIVQLAVLLYQEREPGLRLSVGAELSELLVALRVSADEACTLADSVLNSPVPTHTWEPPANQPLLVELLQLALQNRRHYDQTAVEGLQQDIDRLQEALETQTREELGRLQALKLSALAEMAAGAGHEINNPLAVISGQAQYILKQLAMIDGPAEEIEDIGVYLDNLKGTILPSLHKIVGQTHRIHSILTELMHFARPPVPRVKTVGVRTLIDEVVRSLEAFAGERKVRLIGQDPPSEAAFEGDPLQIRTALAGLLRNAIEAAPAEGWAGVRAQKNSSGSLEIVVEDNGQGPAPTTREHLFDPFYSGRSAGRGRGMGLPTAWRLARQHGGDVRFDQSAQGLTRFILTLPAASLREGLANGHAVVKNGRKGAHHSDASS